jgi:hypothetical protein
MRKFATSRPNEAPMPEPLAYFMTWVTYGSWLPGDERGWVKFRHGFQSPDPVRENAARAQMTESACYLTAAQRELVERTIKRHCEIRQWHLHAVNCRTNHVHVVVTATLHPDDVREQFKAWCTRKLKEAERATNGKIVREKWWAERGSGQYLNDPAGLEGAVLYTLDGQ